MLRWIGLYMKLANVPALLCRHLKPIYSVPMYSAYLVFYTCYTYLVCFDYLVFHAYTYVYYVLILSALPT